MKRIDGVLYRKVRGHAGKVWWVRLTDAEILERDVFHLVLVAVPALLFIAGCFAGGFIG